MRTYRVGDTLPALIVWNILLGIAIVAVVASALDARKGDDRDTLVAVAVILILAGPVAFLAYLARYFLVRVEIAQEGLVVSRRTSIPWTSIRSVRHRGWRLGMWNPFQKLEIGGCGWVFVVLAFKIVIMVVAVVFVLWVLRVLVLPVLVLYSPWHSRVVIETEDGRRLVYRDLEEAEFFVEELEMRMARMARTV
jgi:hypothetical protein